MITVKNIHRVLNFNKIIMAYCLFTNKKYMHIRRSSYNFRKKKERNAIPIPVLKILINI